MKMQSQKCRACSWQVPAMPGNHQEKSAALQIVPAQGPTRQKVHEVQKHIYRVPLGHARSQACARCLRSAASDMLHTS